VFKPQYQQRRKRKRRKRKRKRWWRRRRWRVSRRGSRRGGGGEEGEQEEEEGFSSGLAHCYSLALDHHCQLYLSSLPLSLVTCPPDLPWSSLPVKALSHSGLRHFTLILVPTTVADHFTFFPAFWPAPLLW
jgi:hypothetical protein